MVEIIELLKALILGFVEGMTEFAPVSSTGHMIIVDDMWLKTEEFLGKYPANTFKIVVQLGSILAVIVVMWRRVLLFSVVRSINDRDAFEYTQSHMDVFHVHRPIQANFATSAASFPSTFT